MAMMAAAAFVISVILGIPFIGALVQSRSGEQKQKWVKVADLQSFPEGEPVRINFALREQDAYLEQTTVHSVWVVKRSASEVTAYSPICPHAGCYYNWNTQLRRFECPCHASVLQDRRPGHCRTCAAPARYSPCQGGEWGTVRHMGALQDGRP